MHNLKRYTTILSISLAIFLSLSNIATGQDEYLKAPGFPTFSTVYPVELGGVNVSNGELHLEIPITIVPQRGSNNFSARLVYDSRLWKVVSTAGSYSWQPTNIPGSWSGWRLVIEPVPGTVSSDDVLTTCSTGSYDTYSNFVWVDGSATRHLFGVTTIKSNGCSSQADQPNGSAFAEDGTGYKMNVTNATSVTVYDNAGNQVYPIRKDTNGNYFSVDANGTVTDTLGRIPVMVSSSGNQTFFDVLDSRNSPRQRFTVTTASVPVNTFFQRSLTTEYNGSITVVQSVALPDGTSYSFGYETGTAQGNFGTLKDMTLRTGGQVHFGYGSFTDAYGSKERWVASYQTGNNPQTAFIQAVISTCASSTSTGCQQKVTVHKPSGDEIVYTFTLNNGAWASQAQHYTGSAASGQLLLTQIEDFDFTSPCTTTGCSGAGSIVAQRQTTVVPAPGGSLTKKVEYSFDDAQKRNVTAIKEWQYYTGTPSGTPDRETDIAYVNNAAYAANNIFNLVSSRTVKNAAGATVAQTLVGYDEVALTDVVGVIQHDHANFGTGNTVRGNATSVKNWIAGSTYWETDVFYDATGQVTKSVDGKGNETLFGYSDTFFSDSGTNPPSSFTPTQPTNAYMTSKTAPLIGTSYAGYYFNTGKPAYGKDQNGAESFSHYIDSLDRLTHSYGAALSSGRPWILNAYTSITVADSYSGTTDISASAACSGCIHKQTVTDSFGRVIHNNVVNDPDGAVTNDIIYDATGRQASISNPYRQTSDQTYGIETPAYDGLNRTVSVTHHDGNVSRTFFGPSVTANGGRSAQLCTVANSYPLGYPVLSVDESGHKHQTWIDGLGRTFEVDEQDPSAAATNAPALGTCSKFDASGNLVEVKQGVGAATVQTRSYFYDGLSRLTSTTLPESGTTTLSYLTAGSAKCSGEPSNVCTRTDARGIVTTYYYDALNRLTKKTYSDSNTATAVFNYDETSRFGVSLTNTKGRPSSQYTLDSSNNVIGGSVYSYDAAGRITNNSQCTPRNCASGTYSISYGYSLGGQMTASTNGQGVAFTYQYDGLGRLTALLSSLNDATHPGTLLSNVHYNAINAPSSASTGDALSESYTYNSRLQRTVFTTGSQTGGPPVPGTGTITLNGNEQTIQNGGQSAAAGVGSVTFAGTINSVQRQDCHTEWIWNPDYDEGYEGTVCDPPYTYYDSGRVTVYIGSYSKTIYYSYTSTPDSLAEDLRSQLITDGSSPVTAVRTGAQVTMTAKATGAGTNYSLSTSGATDDYGTFYGPSFSATPASAYFQGGRDYIPASTTYDAGTVTVTVNGYSKQVTYGQGSTKEAVASSLAAAFHNDATAPVDGVLLDSVTVRLTSRTAGASTNYTLNTSSATTQGSFASASFTASRSGATLSGGAANSPNTVYQYSLGYTPNGNINSANDSINGNWTHTYDLLDRLGNSSKTGVNLGFGYDVFGNRTQAASQNLSYDPITNKIASGNGITYDPVGNITVENTGAVTHTYTYDAENRIISVDSGATALYFYDAVGHRIRKTNSGSAFDWQYLYDLAGNQISEIKGSDGAWTRGEVFVGARRLATYINTTSPGITQFNYADWARTDRVRTSMSGNAVLTCTGQPYGDNLSCSGSSPDYSPFHYGTYARDLESNLDFANFRYYNSRLGRFMGVDLLNGNASSPQTLNKFAYVANNPLNALDPSGLDMTDIQPDYDDHNGSWGAAGGGGGFVATQGRTYTVDGIQVSAGFANTLLQSGGVVACGLCGSIVTNSNGEIVDVVRAVFTGNGLEIGFGEAPGGAPAPVYANGPIPVYVGQRRIQNPWIKIFTFGLARHSYFSLTGSDGATHQFEVLGNPGSSHNQQVRDTFGTNRQSSCGTGCEHVVWVSEAQRDALIGGSQYFLSHPCPTCTGGQEGYNLIFHNSNSFVYNMLQFNPAGSIAPPPSAFFTPGYVMRPDNWYPGRP